MFWHGDHSGGSIHHILRQDLKRAHSTKQTIEGLAFRLPFSLAILATLASDTYDAFSLIFSASVIEK
jgi:hypothetical protein